MSPILLQELTMGIAAKNIHRIEFFACHNGDHGDCCVSYKREAGPKKGQAWLCTCQCHEDYSNYGRKDIQMLLDSLERAKQ